MHKIRIEKNQDLPVIEFKLNDGSMHKALIDTGSAFSFFNMNNLGEPSKTQKMEIVTVIGPEKKNLNEYHIDITLQDVEGNDVILEDVFGYQFCWSATESVDMLIGSDLLYKIGAKIDLKNNVLVIK